MSAVNAHCRNAISVWVVAWLVAFLMLTGQVRGDDILLDLALLKQRGVEADADGVGKLLTSLQPSPDQTQRVAALIRQLGAESFADREAAMAALQKMPTLPTKALKAAVKSNDAEVRRRAKRLLESGKGSSPTQVLLFAAFRVVAIKRIEGLASQVMKATPLCQKPPVKAAAERALQVTGGKRVDAPPITWTDLLDSYVVHGKQDGGQTGFVKGLPALPIKQLKVETLTANTINSVTDRHRQAKWLYPVRGKNEIPQILEMNGARWYPVCGTWRQRWQDWIVMDENGTIIRNRQAHARIYYETKVDFIVIALK